MRIPLLLLALALAGCGAPGGTVPPTDDQGRYLITMGDDFRFTPEDARVPLGATVVWRTVGVLGHDVSGYVGDPPTGDFPEFNSMSPQAHGRLLETGEEFVHTFTKSGPWTIWCHTHHEEGMKGIIQVA